MSNSEEAESEGGGADHDEPASPEERLIARRRLLLAKQLYSHALGHADTPGALNKMIAVHNFHNAIELTLRAVLLDRKVRLEKELNIDFESMLNEVPKVAGKGVPQRQELRVLNQKRNHVQHSASEPSDGDMADWKAFTRSFLRVAFKRYFGEDFEGMSAVSLVEDTSLRTLLTESEKRLGAGEWRGAVCLQKLVMYYATEMLVAALSEHSFPFQRTMPSEVRLAIDEVRKRVDEVEALTAVLSSGVSAVDYGRFRRIRVFLHLFIGHRPVFDSSGIDVDEDSARWGHEFVTETVVRWQSLGFRPRVPVQMEAGFLEFQQNGFQDPPDVTQFYDNLRK
jgi:hypothetical protein